MSAPGTAVVHAMPHTGGLFTSCCLALPTELPEIDLYTRDSASVTCTVRHFAEMPVDTDRGESPFGWSAD